MTNDNSTSDNQTTPETGLPQFSVHVVAPQEAKKHLSAMLERFRRGELEPLVIGENQTPEAAVIPFSALLRLMRHDHAEHVRAEHAFQGELSRRVKRSDAERAAGEPSGLTINDDEDFYTWAESLGEVGRQWAQEHRREDRGQDHVE
jgi:antitoxin (DNA-binding transcriptional repressor) of toxin-antitoxin stability system